jgi:alpha-galactosidase
MPETQAAATLPAVGSAGSSAGPALLHLRSAGVSLLVQIFPSSMPAVLHWGADLGELGDAASVAALLPAGEAGSGPGLMRLTGTHDRQTTAPRFADVQVRVVGQAELPPGGSGGVPPGLNTAPVGSGGVPPGPGTAPGLTEIGPDTVIVQAEDPVAGLSLDLAVQLTRVGVVRCRAGVTNLDAERYRLDGLDLFLPVGDSATHILELDEPAVRPLPLRSGGLAVTEVSGRAAHLVLGEFSAGFRRGEVWQAHVAFSGARAHLAEVAPYGRTYLGGGERLQPGEVALNRGEAYHSPWVHWTWGDGLDAAAARQHAEVRQTEVRQTEVRQTEAAAATVIFDATGAAFAEHNRASMIQLAEYAAAVGVETFLLDLKWCLQTGLDPFADQYAHGDADPPRDLSGLLARIRQFDLQVGLAVDLERLGVESAIARDHPEWLLETERDGVIEQVLDLSVRPAMVYVWERLTKLLDRHPVFLLSWSPVTGAYRSGLPGKRHASTLAAYRLLDAVRERYPEVTVISSAMDLAMARRAVTTDRATDSTSRHRQFGSLAQLLPPDRIWQPAYDEVEDGTSPGYRAIAPFFGQLGIGMDLRKQAPASLRAIHRWLELYKGFRPLLHSGRTVRSDQNDSGFAAHGVVNPDLGEALFAFVWLERSAGRRVRLDGLDPAATYRLEVSGPRPMDPQGVVPAWSSEDEGPLLTGRALASAGVMLPVARRGSAMLLHLSSAD